MAAVPGKVNINDSTKVRFGATAASQHSNSPGAGFGCGLNRSMQHLNSNSREGDIENEVSTENQLLKCTEGIDVGSVSAELLCWSGASKTRFLNRFVSAKQLTGPMRVY